MLPINTSPYLSQFLLQNLPLERNITHYHNTKAIPTTIIISFIYYILTSISLILPYILQTHSSQNIQTYFSYIFKLHVSQSNYIQDPYSTKYLHIIPIHIANTISYKTYIIFTISIHLERYQKLFQEYVTKALVMEGI